MAITCVESTFARFLLECFNAIVGMPVIVHLTYSNVYVIVGVLGIGKLTLRYVDVTVGVPGVDKFTYI